MSKKSWYQTYVKNGWLERNFSDENKKYNPLASMFTVFFMAGYGQWKRAFYYLMFISLVFIVGSFNTSSIDWDWGIWVFSCFWIGNNTGDIKKWSWKSSILGGSLLLLILLISIFSGFLYLGKL